MATVFDQKFARFGLTQAQFRVLLAICEAGRDGIAPSTLAAQLLIERATVSVLTTRLVERGWLARTAGRKPAHVPAGFDGGGHGQAARGFAARGRAGG